MRRFVPEGRPAARPSPAGALCAALTAGLSSLGSLPVVMNRPNAGQQWLDRLAAGEVEL